MIPGINIIVVSGNVGADAEVKLSQGGTTLGKFTMAVKNGFGSGDKARPDMWLTVKTFGKQAEFCGDNIKKGIGVCVTGRLEFETWTKQDGTQGSAYVVIASDVKRNFEKSDSGAGQDTGRPRQAGQPPQQRTQTPPQQQRPAGPANRNGAPVPPAAPAPEVLDDVDVPF
jgi:single-strand DNA-binding protein